MPDDIKPGTPELFAWIYSNRDGVEGIVAITLGGMTFPLIMQSKALAMQAKPAVEATVRADGRRAYLKRFVLAETVETLCPAHEVN